MVMTKPSLAAYRRDIHLTLRKYQGGELTALAQRAGLSRAVVYHLRADPYANTRLDTLEKLEHALGLRTTRRGGQ